MSFPLPGFVQFYPTLRCNQHCSFCFNRGIPYSPDMTFENSLRMLDQLCRRNVRELDIMGGEPLLIDWMPVFVREAVAAGLSVNLSTNGSLDLRIREFRGIPSDCLNIGVSLEGDESSHAALTCSDHFNRALEAMRMIREEGFDPIVKTVVSRQTRESVQRIIPRLEKAGVRRYFLIQMDVMTSDLSLLGQALSFPEFLCFYREAARAHPGMAIGKVHASCFQRENLPAGVRCAGGVKKLAIMPDGSVYPCNLLVRFPEFRLGSIITEDLEALWADPVLAAFRTFSRNTCGFSGCTNFDSCTGGCPAHNLMHANLLDGRDIRCSSRPF